MFTTLATARWFFTHGWISLFIIAILFFLIGWFCGWLIWRHCRANAQRIQSENERLEKERNNARSSIADLEQRVQELEA